MKQILFAAFMMLSVALAANSNDPITAPETKTINTEASMVLWTGKKITGKHTGTIKIKSGKLDFDNGILVGGNVIMDMNSITCTDLGEGGAKKLVGHLKSDDFFGVATFPSAELEITNVTTGKTEGSYDITADLTIKGITKSISFSTEMVNNEATAKIVIDRTDFDIRYGSGSFFDDLGDKTIYDDFELEVKLKV